jgi:hypothetical protein
MPQAATAFDTTADGRVDSCDTNGDGRLSLDAFDTNGDERIDLVTAAAAPQPGRYMAPVEAAGLRQLRLQELRGVSQQNSTAATAAATAAADAAADDDDNDNDDDDDDDGDDLARFHSCQSEPVHGSAVPSSTAAGGVSAKATPPGQQQQLDSLFAQAIACGQTDKDAVHMMRRRIETGRSTAQHYISMWSVRLGNTITPQRRAELEHKHSARLLASCTSCNVNVSVALYAFGCVSVVVGTILLIVDGPAPMRVPEPGEREEWERDTIETQAFDVPDEYSPDLKYREGTIFGAWWEHLVLVGWICFLISAIIQRCKRKAGHLDGATTMQRRHASFRPSVRCALIRHRLLKDWSSVAATVVVLCFVVSMCVVLAFTGFSNSGGLLLFWEVKCDRVVCWVHELVGRILVVVVVCVALLLVWAALLLAEAEQQQQKRNP